MSANNLKFLDFEVFPEWWCVVVSDEEDTYPGGVYNNQFDKETEYKIKSKMRVYTSDMDQMTVIQKLKADLLKGVLCGYNIKRYDMIIAKCVINGFSPRKLFIASEIIVDPNKANKDPEYARIATFLKFGWNEAEAWQDLLDDSVKPLKDKECALGIDIRETTVPFGKTNLTQQEKDDIIFYCKHDVYALHVLYWTTSKPYIDTKIQLCDTFGLNRKIGYTNTNAVLSGKVLEAQRVHGTSIIDPTISIYNKELADYFEKWIPADIYKHLLTKQEAKTFKLYDNIVDIGDGGLHSVYDVPNVGKETPALYVQSTEEWTMVNVDASSCYPSVMIFCDSMSRAVRNKQRFIDIFKRRLHLKSIPKSQWTKEDKAFVAAAKLVLNTTYGAMGNKYLQLYDDYMRSKVCRIGQMILISLGNNLYQSIPGLKVIQNNTDGVLVYVRRADIPKVQEIVDEISRITSFTFELEEDSKLWQLNVNNYVAIHPDGEIKNKGGAFVLSVYQPGTNRLRPLGSFCIPRAQIAWLTKGENPIKHLLENTSVEDFCLGCTKGPTYDTMVQYMKDGSIVDLGKVSRVIAITDDYYGAIKKRGMVKRTTKNKQEGDLKEDSVALCPPHPLVINDALYNYKIEDKYLIRISTGEKWAIDYTYYARELDKALDISWYAIVNDKKGFTKRFNL